VLKRLAILLTLLIAAVAAALLYLYLSLRKPAPNAADLVPETTLLFMSVPDFPNARDAFRETALFKLWQEPELQSFLQAPRHAIATVFGGPKPDTHPTGLARLLLEAMQGEVFVAITHFAMIPNLQPGIVLGADVKGKRIHTVAALHRLEQTLRKNRPDARFESKKFLGTRYSVWELQQNLTVCHSFLDSMLIITLDENTIRNVIERARGRTSPDAPPPLSASAAYRQALTHLGQPHHFHAWLNLEQLTALLGPFLAFAPQTSSTFQKLARIRCCALSVTFTGGAIHEVTHTAYNTPRPDPAPATARATLAFTSPQTLLYAVGSTDLAGAYDELMLGLTQSGNPRVASAAMQFEQQLRARNIRIRQQLLVHLGPETALIGAWRAGARLPDAAIIIALTDAGNARQPLDAAMEVLKQTLLGSDKDFPWDEIQLGPQRCRAVRIGSGLLAPAYVVTDRFLLLASTPDFARQLLEQADGTQPNLNANASYRSAIAQLPGNGSSYTWCDLAGLFQPLYETIRPALAKRPATPVLDFRKLPHTHTVAAHLTPYCAATVSDPNGETTVTISPLGRPVMLVAAALAGLAVAQPQFIPAPPKTFSNTAAPPPPAENQTAPSRTASSE
jgi:hypothetical protein